MYLNEIHVLVIDDEEFMRGMVLRFLEMMGISKVTEATDGADGLTKLMNIQLDLIVLDIMMKPMNGLKFPKTVRIGMSDAKRDVPVIVLTGSDEQSVLGTSMALDCNAFVSKTESLDILKSRIMRVLEGPLKIKKTAEYQSVEVPEIINTARPPDQPQDSAPSPTTATEVPIEEVEEGAVVARGVITEDGYILLAAGTVMSPSYLSRLCDISEIIEVPSIWIEK